jgi:hypothetical protein
MRWLGQVGRMVEKKYAFKTLVGKSGGNRPLQRPRRRCKENNKVDFKEI